MFVSVVVVRSLLEEIERRGIARKELLPDGRLDEDRLADLRTMISADVLDDIVLRATELLRDPALGLSLGTRQPEGLGQIISHLALSVPTLRDSYTLLERYSPILVDDIHQSLTQDGERVIFRFDFHDGMGATTTRFAAEYLCCFCLKLADRFAPNTPPLEMRFRYPEPAHAARYKEVFGCAPRFGADEYAIICPAEMFERRQFHADTTISEMLRAAADQLLTQVGTARTFADRVRALLRQQPDLAHVDINQVSRRLGMGARTLRRRLSEESANFSHLLEQERVDRARVELLRPGANIKQTAERLGYSEPSAFHRAFKRWTGVPPATFVRNQRPDAADESAPQDPPPVRRDAT